MKFGALAAQRDMDVSPDLLVSRLAQRQHGVVTYAQARRAGLSATQIQHRVDTGRWIAVHRGVFRLGVGIPPPGTRYLAAAFGGGPDAVLFGRSATSSWGVQPHHWGPVHVVSGISRRSREGIAVHWTRRFDPGVRTVRHGVPVTTLARTLIDLAEVAGAEEVETAVRAAERLHDFDRRLLVPIPGRRGSGRLVAPDVYFRGDLEPLLRRLLDDHDLQQPIYNAGWRRFELDAVWWDIGLVLEVDDWDTHRHRDAFIRDRRRSREVQAAGLRATQCTYEDLTVDKHRFAAELRDLGVPLLTQVVPLLSRGDRA